MASPIVSNLAIPLLVMATICNAHSAENFFFGIESTTTTVAQYGRFEVTFQIPAQKGNPFDAKDIDISAHIRSPSGKVLTTPAFLRQDFRSGVAPRGIQYLSKVGEPEWCVRYTPSLLGTYEVRLHAKIGAKEHWGPTLLFECVAGNKSGFVRVAANARAFKTDDGAPFFAIGANTCWGRDTFDYDRWFLNMAENGLNTGRLWIGPIGLFTLEHKTSNGAYDQQAAWKIDYVLQLAERHGIRLMFCLESFNTLRIKPEYPEWQNSPYNSANGGPCQNPEDFFTDPAAREMFKRRMRYVVARWGYSPNVLCWEFWNEVDLVENYNAANIKAWHAEMSAELSRLDIYSHLQSTSYSKPEGEPEIDALPELTFVQTHSYTAKDLAADFTAPALQKSERFARPHLLGEFGLHWAGKGNDADPEGLHLRETIWSTALAGSAGCGMSWWWDSYLEPKKLWPLYRPLAAFSAKVPWTAPHAAPLKAEFSYDPGFVGVPQDIFVVVKDASWNVGPSNEPQNISVARDGTLSGGENLSAILHGRGHHRDKHNPVTFNADSSRPWVFGVKVSGVSGHGGGNLRILLDNELVIFERFLDDDAFSNDTINEYNKLYTINVPAGVHAVRVENTGTDWVTCQYQLGSYGESAQPPLRFFHTNFDREAVGWIQNTTASYLARTREATPRLAVGTRLTLSPAAAGSYELEVWNTVNGSYETHTLEALDGKISFRLPNISSDLALKLRRK